MTTQINQDNIQPSTLALLGSGPTVTNIQITNSSYEVLDDTAVSLSGGYIIITGTNFASGCEVIIGSTNATSVSLVSSTTLNVQVPALSAGTYVVYVVNTDGAVAIRVNGLTYSGSPTWVTGSTLPGGVVNTSISIQLSATGDTPLTYSLQSGSSLPSGLTLTSGGLLSGTITGITSETIYNFTIEVTDIELQESPRAFSITITASDQYFSYVSTLLSPELAVKPYDSDASTNNFEVTPFGNTRPNNFNPYTPGYYSNYFDTSGDSLTVPYGSTLALGTSDCTIEAWVFLNSYPQQFSNVIDVRESSVSYSNNAISFSVENDGTFTFYAGSYSPDIPVLETASGKVPLNTWVYLALTRLSGTTKLYVNGISEASSANAWNQTSGTATTLYIGNAVVTRQVNGYISNLRVVKGTAVYTANFTPSTTPLTNITNTSLLTCQSNRFIDNSTNNFAITRVGDTRVTSFVPFTPNTNYSSYGSAYFDGTDDYLTVASNSALNLPGNFTIELWAYFTALSSNRVLLERWSSGVAGTWQLYWSSTGSSIVWYIGGAIIIQDPSSTSISLNTWNHIAVTRSGTTTRLFVNGILVGTATNSTDLTNSQLLSVGIQVSTGTNDFSGYITDVRIVNGTAVYTTNFTLPAAPLTAIENTVLLTCQTNQPDRNSQFLDSSTVNNLITRAGNTTQGTFSPYGENWSNYFDGSGDYLTLPTDSGIFNFGTGDFTIEAWIYPTLLSGLQQIAGPSYSSTGGALYLSDSRLTIYTTGTESNANRTSLGSILSNQWQHVAAVRSNGTLLLYINGVLQTTTTFTNNLTTNNAVIGSRGATLNTELFNGYISNLRVVKSAVYTANFTPSTTPLQPIQGTSLLTCRDSNFIDDSANNFAITRVGDVSVQKFGPFAGTTLPTPAYSTYITANTNYWTLSSAPVPSTGSFTLECWIYLTSYATITAIYSQYLSTDAGRWSFSLENSSGYKLRFASPTVLQGNTVVALNQWHHVVLQRDDSNLMSIFLNGVLDNSGTIATALYTGNPRIGQVGTAPTVGWLPGYISNMRVVSGQAMYSGTFTPSTAPLTATDVGSTGAGAPASITGTVTLLACQSNIAIDNSPTPKTLTANGSVRLSAFSPFTVSYSIKQSYTPSVFGGSMYFDGTGDYLDVPNSVTNQLSGAQYTIEMWVYPTTTSTERSIFNKNGATTFGYLVYLTTGNVVRFRTDSTDMTAGTLSAPTNAWTHIAVTNDGTTTRIFVNGILSTSSTGVTITSANEQGVLRIGARQHDASLPLTGYMSGVRLIKGSALYTSNFVPENRPPTPIKDTTVLVNGTGAAIYDSTTLNDFETVGSVRLGTSLIKYGNTSLNFPSTESWLRAFNADAAVFGTGNFTVEMWVDLPTNLRSSGVLISFTSLSVETAGRIQQTSGNSLYWIDASNNPGFGIGAKIEVSLSTWTHVAICRSGTTLRYFKDGVQVASGTDSSNYIIRQINVAARATGSGRLTCSISDLRITKGIARYTANFTPPTSAASTF